MILLFSLLITFFFSILTIGAGGFVKVLVFFQLLAISFILILTGQLTLSSAKAFSLPCRNFLSILIGFVICSLFVNFLVSFSHLSATSAFLSLSIIIVIWAAIFPRVVLTFFSISNQDFIDGLVMLFIMTFVLLWSWQTAGSMPSIQNLNILPAWVDYYIHGAEIAQFSDLKSVGHGSVALSGVPLFFYHRGIYMLPAVIANITNLPGVAAATALLLPLGLLLLGLAIYALGAQLSNPIGGILGIICIYVLPDASLYGMKNGFFGFHYSLFVSPGTAYGISICLLSMIFFIHWLRTHDFRLWIFSFILASSVMFFRAQFFILYFPIFLFLSILQLNSIKKYHHYIILSLIPFFILFVLLVVFSHDIRNFWLSKSVVLQFLDIVHLNRGITAYTEFYKHVSELHIIGLTISLGIILIFMSILGIWIILYPITLYKKITLRGWEAIDYYPILLFIGMSFIILFAPAAVNGTFDEYQHRPFGLLYVVVILFSMTYSLTLLNYYFKKITPLIKILTISLVVLSILIPAMKSKFVLFNTLFSGISLYGDYHIETNSDVIKLSGFLQKNAKPGDSFLVDRDDTDSYCIDSASIITSISGVSAYLARPYVQITVSNNERKGIIIQRVKIAESIKNCTQFSTFNALLNKNKISWYVAFSPPIWDPQGQKSVYKNGSILLYHM